MSQAIAVVPNLSPNLDVEFCDLAPMFIEYSFVQFYIESWRKKFLLHKGNERLKLFAITGHGYCDVG